MSALLDFTFLISLVKAMESLEFGIVCPIRQVLVLSFLYILQGEKLVLFFEKVESVVLHVTGTIAYRYCAAE